MTITVYTQDQCPPCEFIKNFLTSNHYTFEEKNIKHHPYKLEMMDYDAFSTPFLLIDDTPVHQIDMAKIESLLQETAHD